MVSLKNFGRSLEVLEAHEDQRFTFESQVSVAIYDKEKVLCGLKNGDICLLTMGKDIARVESPSPRSEVTCLCWVGTDRCISGHKGELSRLWDLAERRELAVLGPTDQEQGEFDRAVAVDSDGMAVLASSLGNLRHWNLEQLNQEEIIKAHDVGIYHMSVTGEKCITGTDDVALKVWNVNTREKLAELPSAGDRGGCIEFISNNKCLISKQNEIEIWDLSEHKKVACYKGHQRKVTAMREVCGDRCVSCGEDSIHVWSLKDLSEIHQFPFQAYCLEVQGNLLYCGTISGLAVASLQTYQVTATVDMKMRVEFVHYFGGKCICIPANENCAYAVEIDEYREMDELCGHKSGVNGTLQLGSSQLLSWSSDKYLRVWNVYQHEEQAELKGHSNPVTCAALASGRCISGDSGGYLKVWDLSNMKEIPTNMRHPAGVKCIVVTDGKAITGGEMLNVFVWDLGKYENIGELKGHTDKVCRLLLASNNVVISASLDKTIRVWDVQKCVALATLEGHQKQINEVALASENRCISVSDDKTVKLWSLQKCEPLVTFQEHTDEVWTVAAAGAKCVTGSKDKTIIVWNLANYLVEARILCTSEVTRVQFFSEVQYVSGHLNGEVKVWEDYRELATFKGHSKGINSLTLLSDSRLATSAVGNTDVRVCDLGQLSSCLLLCNICKVFEKEMSEGKVLHPQYRSRISDFKRGKRVPPPESRMLFRPYFFNCLHLCAYYNHPALLSEYLEEGVPLLRGVFGSPLTLALERKTIECVDAILEYLIALAPRGHAWKGFQAVNDELLTLLGSGSSKLEAFFSVLLQRPSQQVPTFINPNVPLPITLFVTHSNVFKLGIFLPGEIGEDLVKFSVSLVHWNYTAGSRESIEMLAAAVDCGDRRVLLGDYFRSIIEQKWDNCFPFTLSVAMAYWAMLVCLMGTINLQLVEFGIAYLALNAFFAFYESAQVIAMGSEYFTEGWNVVDFLRCTLSISWVSLRLMAFEEEVYLTPIVVFLDFIRGFTHFRSFRTTRIFVYMTFTVVAEVYSFLLILAYSVFAFGVITSVITSVTTSVDKPTFCLYDSWKNAYKMVMGEIETTSYGALEWVVFTGATVTNVVIMMNLLISILGEAYEKAQMTMLENDLYMQANLLLEYETLMIWRRREVSKRWVVTCRRVEGGGEQLEWSGKVLQIVNSLSEGLSQVKEEIGGKVNSVDGKMKTIDSKVAGIEKSIEGLKAEVGGLGKKLDEILQFLQYRL